MSTRPSTSKEELLDAAFEIACEKGLSGVNVRAVAAKCGVAVGTVYNWYPAKSDLISDVIALFWREALKDCMPKAAECGDFIEFCEELSCRMARAFSKFHDGWLAEIASMRAHDLDAAREREQACFSHIRRGLAIALEQDDRICRKRLTGDLRPEAVCLLVWDAILASIRRNDDSYRTLLALLRQALYR